MSAVLPYVYHSVRNDCAISGCCSRRVAQRPFVHRIAPLLPPVRSAQASNRSNLLILLVPPPRLERGTPRSTIWSVNGDFLL